MIYANLLSNTSTYTRLKQIKKIYLSKSLGTLLHIFIDQQPLSYNETDFLVLFILLHIQIHFIKKKKCVWRMFNEWWMFWIFFAWFQIKLYYVGQLYWNVPMKIKWNVKTLSCFKSKEYKNSVHFKQTKSSSLEISSQLKKYTG